MSKCTICGGIHQEDSRGLYECAEWMVLEQYEIRKFLDSKGGTLEVRPGNLADYMKHEFKKIESRGVVNKK